MRAPRDRLLLAVLLASGVGLVACDDGGGAPCLLDSDCADLSQVCLDSRCRPAGELPEGGAGVDAGGGSDAGARMDAGRDAGGSPDSGAPADAGADAATTDGGGLEDAAPADAALPPCPDATGTWTIGVVNGSCGGAAVGYALTVSAVGAECNFTASTTNIGQPSLDGTFTLDMAGNLTGTMGAGGGATVECTGAIAGAAYSVTCGDCTLDLTR